MSRGDAGKKIYIYIYFWRISLFQNWTNCAKNEGQGMEHLSHYFGYFKVVDQFLDIQSHLMSRRAPKLLQIHSTL